MDPGRILSSNLTHKTSLAGKVCLVGTRLITLYPQIVQRYHSVVVIVVVVDLYCLYSIVKYCKVLSYVCCSPDLLPLEDLKVLSEISGCAARVRDPSCRTIQNLDKYRTTTSVCNNL